MSGLVNGTSYAHYVRCQDTSGNANTTDFAITFSVASAADVDTADGHRNRPGAGGATVSGTISVTANASDNQGVVGVQFLLDGANLGAEDITCSLQPLPGIRQAPPRGITVFRPSRGTQPETARPRCP